jgi:single-strand DNA-binding protein
MRTGPADKAPEGKERTLNQWNGIGNLTRDIDLRFTPNGNPVANFGIAVNRKFKKGDGDHPESDFFNVVAWGKLAELLADHIGKGSPVGITGRLQYRKWEANDGHPRSTVEIVAEDVKFLNKRGDDQGARSQRGAETSHPIDEDIPF